MRSLIIVLCLTASALASIEHATCTSGMSCKAVAQDTIDLRFKHSTVATLTAGGQTVDSLTGDTISVPVQTKTASLEVIGATGDVLEHRETFVSQGVITAKSGCNSPPFDISLEDEVVHAMGEYVHFIDLGSCSVSHGCAGECHDWLNISLATKALRSDYLADSDVSSTQLQITIDNESVSGPVSTGGILDHGPISFKVTDSRLIGLSSDSIIWSKDGTWFRPADIGSNVGPEVVGSFYMRNGELHTPTDLEIADMAEAGHGLSYLDTHARSYTIQMKPSTSVVPISAATADTWAADPAQVHVNGILNLTTHTSVPVISGTCSMEDGTITVASSEDGYVAVAESPCAGTCKFHFIRVQGDEERRQVNWSSAVIWTGSQTPCYSARRLTGESRRTATFAPQLAAKSEEVDGQPESGSSKGTQPKQQPNTWDVVATVALAVGGLSSLVVAGVMLVRARFQIKSMCSRQKCDRDAGHAGTGVKIGV